MSLDEVLQGVEKNRWFIEVRNLWKYYTNNLQLLNLNNYTELSKTYERAVYNASLDLIKVELKIDLNTNGKRYIN